MSLFNFGKKKNENKGTAPCACCSCQQSKADEQLNTCCPQGSEIFSIKVLGAGCKACHEQYENTKQAVKSLGLSVEAEYITDMKKVMEYGVMSMPAIVINEKVVSSGKVLNPAEIEKLLNK